MTFNRQSIAVAMLALMICIGAAGAEKKFTLVVDAGHGGHDAGAVGKKTKEKNLTLKYALAFGEMVEKNCPDVKVVYTRKTDRFLELWQRAEIANKQKADLFISVHINSLPKGKIARGFQTYTLGRGRNTGTGFIENLEVAKRENSVIFLEQNYKQTYHGYDPNSPESDIMFELIQDDNMQNSVELARLMQQYVCKATGRQNQGAHQDNLAVLRLTSMPGCLVELGFISTPDEEAFMMDASSTQKYAQGMLNAFQAYRRKHNPAAPAQPAPKQDTPEPKQEVPVPKQETTAPKQETPAPKQETTAPKQETTDSGNATVFKVQILASATKLKDGAKELKGLKDVDAYKEGNLWKHTVGASENYNEVLALRKSLLKDFPQAFIVAFKNNEKTDAAEAIKEFKKNNTQKK